MQSLVFLTIFNKDYNNKYMDYGKEFKNYATKHHGINSYVL